MSLSLKRDKVRKKSVHLLLVLFFNLSIDDIIMSSNPLEFRCA